MFLQLLIEIAEASSVITWDFDVCKGDVIFHIYHSKRAPQPPKKDSLGAHGIASPGASNVPLIDRSWVLGQDYSMVETALTCKEGESVQDNENEDKQNEGITGKRVTGDEEAEFLVGGVNQINPVNDLLDQRGGT